MQLKCIDRKGTDCSKWDDINRKFGTNDVTPLWVADMDFASPKCVEDVILARAKHPVYGYTIYSDAFYDSIVNWYKDSFGWNIEPEWIVPEHGVVLSINLAINEYTNQGDGVIVQTPIYPPFLGSVKINGRKVLENRLVMENGKVTIDFEDFENQAREAKLFLLCSPHNPTTRAWSKSELQKMLEICHSNGVIVVADEIHSDLVFDKKHVPIASIDSTLDNVITLHAPSKTFNIAGLNTSYAIIPNDSLRRRYKHAHDRAGLDNGNLFGIAALEAVYSDDGEWLERLRGEIKKNYEYVKSFINENIPEIIVYEHQATFLAWLDCRGLGMDNKNLEEFFIKQAKLGLNSGYSFGEHGGGFMRLNLGTSLDILKKAMSSLEKALQERDK